MYSAIHETYLYPAPSIHTERFVYQNAFWRGFPQCGYYVRVGKNKQAWLTRLGSGGRHRAYTCTRICPLLAMPSALE
eukprot:7287467-Pyramimonas_sp.AAC.2